ncbi:MAG: N-acetylglutaminylglutamine synthetase [Rhodospirillales bacterium]
MATSKANSSTHRIERHRMTSLGTPGRADDKKKKNVAIECGWGRLIFAHTFESNEVLSKALKAEKEGCRDIAFYVRDPHVLLSMAPQEFFLDPSHTYRLWFDQYKPSYHKPRGFTIKRLRDEAEAKEVNRIFTALKMATVDRAFVVKEAASRVLNILVAVDSETGDIIGTVTGIDHKQAFNDPENGSSLWCLAVDPQTARAGVGEALVRQLAERFHAQGRGFMDLSVMHDNRRAIALYEKLGFQRIPVFTLKHKNPINERLFIGPGLKTQLNPYAEIIVNEARRRGIAVEVLDSKANYFSLSFGGRTIVCRESLSELTNAIAMSRCDDKAVTRRILKKTGLRVPDQIEANEEGDVRDFLEKHHSVVVKPARGEQGAGVSVNLHEPDDIALAVEDARKICERVLIEEFVEGMDLRIIVIDFDVVAAAVRKPPMVMGDGKSRIKTLIGRQSRRRSAATGGESRIPLDEETRRCVGDQGYTLEAVLEYGKTVCVREAANLHTGGTIHDVTNDLHPELRRAAIRAARALDIPVVGLDFMVPAVDRPDYAIIEANERPGLANHEPQPTAERFIDLLFPQTIPA